MFQKSKLWILLPFFLISQAWAQEKIIPAPSSKVESVQSENALDELDPFDPQVEQKLEEYDRIYEQETGKSAHIDSGLEWNLELFGSPSCFRQQCEVWVQVVKSTQTMYLYVGGQLQNAWKVSTGVPGHETPRFDTHPNGRIYDRYNSKAYPGGDYQGMGNMPYAVFISGGFAIHGTGVSNWKKLGQKASHGCIRLHPDNARYFNRLVRQAGIRNVWITVQD